MATLTPGRPITVQTPELLVENQLPVGTYRFQLVVTDDGGLESSPAELVVTVRRPVVRPDVVLRPDLVLRADLLRPAATVRPDIRINPNFFVTKPPKPQ
jgi:hypothetical protein